MRPLATTNQYRISKLGLRSDAYFTSKDSRHRWCCIRSLRVAANHWLMWATFIINQLQGYDRYEASFCFLFINLKKKHQILFFNILQSCQTSSNLFHIQHQTISTKIAQSQTQTLARPPKSSCASGRKTVANLQGHWSHGRVYPLVK